MESIIKGLMKYKNIKGIEIHHLKEDNKFMARVLATHHVFYLRNDEKSATGSVTMWAEGKTLDELINRVEAGFKYFGISKIE